MTFSNINTSTPNSGLGDKLRDAFVKVNYNFSQIINQVSYEELQDILDGYARQSYVDDTCNTLYDLIVTLQGRADNDELDIAALQTDLSSLGLLVDGKASLTQLNDSVSNINSTIAALQIVVDSKIGEAPQNGTTYGRRNGGWTAVTGGTNKIAGTLFQRGKDTIIDITSGTLEIGRTYWIQVYQSGDDFSNCGDNQNIMNKRWIATSDTPTNWSNGTQLQTFEGSPVINILENTLPFPFHFEYNVDGEYWIRSYEPLFTSGKTFCLLTDMFNKGDENQIDVRLEYWNGGQMKLLTKNTNDILSGHCIEIRVYN